MGRKGVISLSSSGDYKKTRDYLKKVQSAKFYEILNKYGAKGVQLLSERTPKDTGKTAASWSYSIVESKNGPMLYWNNSNTVGGKRNIPIVLLIEYGHATPNGGYVAPNEFINPAIQEIYNELSEELRKELQGV